MAKVLIYTNNLTYDPDVRLSNAIRNAGYEVSLVIINSFTTENVKSYGPPGSSVSLVICTIDLSTTQLSSFLALKDLGYVFMLNLSTTQLRSVGLSGSTDSVATPIGLSISNNTRIFSEETRKNLKIPKTNTLTCVIDKYLTPGYIKLVSSAYYAGGIREIVFLYDKGTKSSTGVYLKVPLFYSSLLRSVTEDTLEIFSNIFKDIISFSIRSTYHQYHVSGSVFDQNGNPLKRVVAIYSPVSKELLNIGESNEVTGFYDIGVHYNNPVFIVMNPTETEKPDIHYNIIPETNPEYP